MTEFDPYPRAKLTYDRFKWLSALSAGAIVFLVGFLDRLVTFSTSMELLSLAVMGLAFTLFVSIGLQIVASAADRWQTEAISPALLVWEWRLLAAAHLVFMVSILLLVTFFMNNLQPLP
jgi:hypothetical protein